MGEKRYYVSCPYKGFSGGPHLCHQLCKMLNDLGINAKMHYYDWETLIVDWKDVNDTVFGKYNTTHVTDINELDSEDSIIIFPETKWYLPKAFDHAKTHMWWMSVFYYEWTTDWFDKEVNDWFRNDYAKNGDSIHFVQSQYAYDYCLNTLEIPEHRIQFLSDYIDEIFTEDFKEQKRENIVFYNPNKMSDIQTKLIEMETGINWVAIENMASEEVRDSFRHGKVYVDFGNHPGKDRIPREAASCGCCIITNREGAAANDKDVRIPKKYKIKDVSDIDNILNTINYCLENFDKCTSDFDNYRKWIKDEKKRFKTEVKRFISLTKGDM